jgi:hypothetical protein
LIEVKDTRRNGTGERVRDFDSGTLPRSGRKASKRLAGCDGYTFTRLRRAAEEVPVIESLHAISSQIVDLRIWRIEEVAEMFSGLWVFWCNSSRATHDER